MADKSVTPDPWDAIADELERIAKDVRALVGEPAPGCFDINIQPRNADGYGKNTVKNRPATAAATDAIAKALLGKPSTDVKMGDGSFHRNAAGRRGRIGVAVYTSIADPDAVDPDEEIARLRAEVEQLRGLAYSREADESEASR